MIAKKEKSFTFVDAALIHSEKRWQGHWLHKIQKIMNWKSFSREREKLYAASEGRPALDPVVLFRCLLLAEWNGLSNRALEEALEFRFDFKKFTGLGME